MSLERLACGALGIQEGFNVSVCVLVHTEVCSQQLGLCSHGDGCEGL